MTAPEPLTEEEIAELRYAMEWSEPGDRWLSRTTAVRLLATLDARTRERDEARRTLAHQRKGYEELIREAGNRAIHADDTAAAAERERDEAARQFTAKLSEFHDVAQQAMRDRANMERRAEVAERERDEALKERQILRDDLYEAQGRVTAEASKRRETERERDALREALTFDLVTHLRRQRDFSQRTFGPGNRTAGVCDHIRKELREIEAAPNLEEWCDVILLAFDGAWRSGAEPEDIARNIAAKQGKNESREWPDWRTSDPNKAIEHIRPALAPRPPAQEE